MAYHLIGEAGEWLGAQAILRTASRKAIPAATEPPEG
jgi:hypothetical protein